MNVSDGTTFPDDKGTTWIPNGNAQVISNYYVGDGSGDYLSHSGTDDARFQMGAGDFTFEGFLQTTANDVVIYDNRAAGGPGGLVMYIKASTGVLGAFSNIGSPIEILGVTAVNDNALHHFAFSRVSGTLYIALDGAIGASGAMADNFFGSGKLFIGATNGATMSFNGKLRGLRVTKGVGRYSGAYTVPTWPLPNF